MASFAQSLIYIVELSPGGLARLTEVASNTVQDLLFEQVVFHGFMPI